MSRPRSSRARWDPKLRALILPVPEVWVQRLALQWGRQGSPGVEAVGAWLRARLQVMAVGSRRGPRPTTIRVPGGKVRVRHLAEQEQGKKMKKR